MIDCGRVKVELFLQVAERFLEYLLLLVDYELLEGANKMFKMRLKLYLKVRTINKK